MAVRYLGVRIGQLLVYPESADGRWSADGNARGLGDDERKNPIRKINALIEDFV